MELARQQIPRKSRDIYEHGPSSKRQRISQACEMCRNKKNKCNGERPACSSCVSLDQPCFYSSDSRRRGLRSGYVRLLEMLWGLVFEVIPQSEATVLQLLKDVHISTDVDGKSFLQGQHIANPESLHRLWSKSRARAEIERLISNFEAEPEPYRDFFGRADRHIRLTSSGSRQPTVASGAWHLPPGPTRPSDITTEGGKDINIDTTQKQVTDPRDPGPTAHGSASNEHESPLRRSLSQAFVRSEETPSQPLPSNGWRLLNIYFCYTHSWLPIVDKYKVFRTFHSCSATPGATGEMAVLWAILAYASIQDSHADLHFGGGQAVETVSELPFQYYHNAERLVLESTAIFTRDHVDALLILAMIDMGFRNFNKAWLSVGHAIRILQSIWEPTLISEASSNTDQKIRDEHARNWLGCFIVETLISSRVGRKPQLTSQHISWPSRLSEDGTEEWDIWVGQSGFNTSIASTGLPSMGPSRAKSIFNQYVDLIRILNAILHDPPEGPGLSDMFERRSISLQKWEMQLPPHCKHPAVASECKNALTGLTPQLINLHLCHSSTVILLNAKMIGSKTQDPLLQPTVSPQYLVKLFCDNFGLSAIPASFEAQLFISQQHHGSEDITHGSLNHLKTLYGDKLTTLWPAFQELFQQSCLPSHQHGASGGPFIHEDINATIKKSYLQPNYNSHENWNLGLEYIDQVVLPNRLSASAGNSIPPLNDTLLMHNFNESEARLENAIPPPGRPSSSDGSLQPFFPTEEDLELADVGDLDNFGLFGGVER